MKKYDPAKYQGHPIPTYSKKEPEGTIPKLRSSLKNRNTERTTPKHEIKKGLIQKEEYVLKTSHREIYNKQNHPSTNMFEDNFLPSKTGIRDNIISEKPRKTSTKRGLSKPENKKFLPKIQPRRECSCYQEPPALVVIGHAAILHPRYQLPVSKPLF